MSALTDLADRLKQGLAPDNLAKAIDEFSEWAVKRPDVGNTVARILGQVYARWDDGYALPPAEMRTVTDAVVPRVLDILRKLDSVSNYEPLQDLIDLMRAYEAVK